MRYFKGIYTILDLVHISMELLSVLCSLSDRQWLEAILYIPANLGSYNL